MNAAKFVEVEFNGQKYIAIEDSNDRMSVCAVGHIQGAGMEFLVRSLIAAAKYHADFHLSYRHVDTRDLDEVALSPSLHAAVKFCNGNLFPLGSPRIVSMRNEDVDKLRAESRQYLVQR